MPQIPLPPVPENWAYFADWSDISLGLVGVILIALLTIWWWQQTDLWFRVIAGSFLSALLLCIASLYLFEVPPYVAGCPTGCEGWSGFPLPVARLPAPNLRLIAPIDFLLNLLLLWLLWMGAGLVWSLLGVAFEWENRTLRARIGWVLLVAVLPWALLPRVINPPQPVLRGEELRLANNARRAAEFTYRITGFGIQRLAIEDVRAIGDGSRGEQVPGQEELAATEVCLRGYTYFYLPWQRYRITLDTSGTTALNLERVPLGESCWRNETALSYAPSPKSPVSGWKADQANQK